eukprot:1099885-Rhodomonas_salina.1
MRCNKLWVTPRLLFGLTPRVVRGLRRAMWSTPTTSWQPSAQVPSLLAVWTERVLAYVLPPGPACFHKRRSASSHSAALRLVLSSRGYLSLRVPTCLDMLPDAFAHALFCFLLFRTRPSRPPTPQSMAAGPGLGIADTLALLSTETVMGSDTKHVTGT